MLNTCKSNVVFGELGRRKQRLLAEVLSPCFFRAETDGKEEKDGVCSNALRLFRRSLLESE